MADTITELITQNIVTSLHGETINYDGEDRTITCERERFINTINDRYPYCKLSGPIVEVVGRAHSICNCNCHYMLTLTENTIRDEYDPENDVDEITRITGNVAGDMIKLLVGSVSLRTRGGYARNTQWEGYGYYFDFDEDTPLYCVYLQLIVKTVINEIDPYLTGG